jgi:hypothetical protein
LYFASAIEREDRELNDSLDGDDIDGLAKVVKKGSFKIIKPNLYLNNNLLKKILI